jgi:nucleotide-binding universal stress UspA family protein
MYKTILVYLDSAERAEATISHVEELAQSFDSDVVLTQVVLPPSTYLNPWSASGEDESSMLDAEVMLARWRGRLVERGIGTRVSVLPGYDSVAETIVAHARAARIDLILMPRRLNTDLLGWSAEGVTEEVMRSAHCDVLIAKELEPVW